MSENGRIARFVKAARTLLLMQLGAALLAVALAIWAVAAVWELAAERDRLRAQVHAMQSRQPAAEGGPLAENPVLNEVRPPALLPIAIPVSQVPPDVNMILPDAAAIPPANDQATEPVPETPPAGQDCTADPTQPRCRPERWRPPVRQRPGPRVEPEPQQPPAETPPRPN
jgi:hypothetical protein